MFLGFWFFGIREELSELGFTVHIVELLVAHSVRLCIFVALSDQAPAVRKVYRSVNNKRPSTSGAKGI